jgi:group I intron endonuclease
MNAGVYQIRNVATGQIYIGRASNVPARIGQHKTELRYGRHFNLHLQRSFAKYGAGAFTFEPLLFCRKEDAPFYEHLLIKGFRSDDPARGFNKTLATETHLTHTPEARAKIAEYNRTLKPKYERTPEIRAKIAASLTGKVGPNKGKKFSDEHRAKLAAAKLKSWSEPAYRETMLAKLQDTHELLRARKTGGDHGDH